jgi:hypothetical protein
MSNGLLNMADFRARRAGLVRPGAIDRAGCSRFVADREPVVEERLDVGPSYAAFFRACTCPTLNGWLAPSRLNPRSAMNI